jgi:hypothetical protein
MRREQDMEAVVIDHALQRLEAHLLKDHVATRIGQHRLLDAVCPCAQLLVRT